MRWEDERYVKVYTRETPEWAVLSWEARAVFHELLKKVDRAGIIMVGKSGMRGLAGLLRMPVDVIERGLTADDGLLEDGCVVTIEGGFMLPNFIEAQEAKQSDKLRKQAQRERDRSDRLGRTVTPPKESGRSVTKRDDESQNVTESHNRSHGVTTGHTESLLAQPCLAQPSSAEISSSPPPPPIQPDRACEGRAAAGEEPEESELERIEPEPPAPRTLPNPATQAIADALRAAPALKHLAAFSEFVVDLAHHCREHGFTGQFPLAVVVEVIAEIGAKVARRAKTGSPMGYDAITELVIGAVRRGPSRRSPGAAGLPAAAGPPADPAAVDEVWNAYVAAWVSNSKGPTPARTQERSSLIAARLQDHPATLLVAALRGAWRSDWHVKARRTTIEVVLHNSSTIDEHSSREFEAKGVLEHERLKRTKIRLETLAPPAQPTMAPAEQAAAARSLQRAIGHVGSGQREGT